MILCCPVKIKKSPLIEYPVACCDWDFLFLAPLWLSGRACPWYKLQKGQGREFNSRQGLILS